MRKGNAGEVNVGEGEEREVVEGKMWMRGKVGEGGKWEKLKKVKRGRMDKSGMREKVDEGAEEES